MAIAQRSSVVEAKEEILVEIRDALAQMESAKRYFECVTEASEIDYAVYAIIAAEKRYAMLVQKAKKMEGQWPKWGEWFV